MTTPEITVPREALEAAKREATVAIHSLVDPDTRAHELTEDEVGEIALAACLAMLKAWPGAYGNGPRKQWKHYTPAIILPLPKEPEHD